MTQTSADHNGSGASPRLGLVAVRDEPLSVDEIYAAVSDPAAGGVVVFVGAVRDSDGGKAVDRLGYSAHPSALTRLQEVTQQVARRWPVVALAAVHRVGDLEVGDLAVVVGASAAHRGDAFEAARALIDELKATVPIWKHQEFSDGSQEWVGTP
jgi:molybdopterin synthase catalytic subunit